MSYFLPVGLCFVCAKSEAATSFSFLVEFGLLKILPASDAAFLPVVIVLGSFLKGYLPMKQYYEFILTQIEIGMDDDQIDALLSANDYHWLRKDRPVLSKKAKKMSGDAKEYAFLRDMLEKAFVCNLCTATIDKKSMQRGHTIDRKDGGAPTVQNSEWQHPFCNSTFKPYLEREGTTFP